MINKLRTKVSLIILFAISIPLFLVIIFYTFSYCNNVIRSNVSFMDRLFEPSGPKNKKNMITDSYDIDGIYFIMVTDEKVFSYSDDTNDQIKKYASKILNKNSDYGIIGNYIYSKKTHEISDNISIILIDGSNQISEMKLMIISSIIILVIALFLIYVLSKKIASIIVRPVEETFKKQIDFISDASHELKTPLAVIQANSDVLESEIGKNKWLSYIQNETDNMGKLINELLLLTKIENIDKLREPERFNISNHIELVVASFESMAYERKVKIDTMIQKDVITDNFNKDDIEHILSTLVDNAIKHTDEKKKVIVEFRKNKDNIEINVKNRGKEIPVCEREKIFDRFYRIDKSRNRNEKRYGLGLAIAKSTVLKNNGTIMVDYLDGYTIFSVKLPL